MKTCSFCGRNRIYEENLKAKIEDAIRGILPFDDSFQFYFLHQNKFYNCCCEAARQIKTERPDLEIILKLADCHQGDHFKSAEMQVRQGQYDKIVYPQVIDNKLDFINNIKRIEKWIVQKSDYLFSYTYMDRDCVDRNLLACVDKQVKAGKLQIIDLTAPRTKIILQEKVRFLPERDRYIYLQMNGERTETGLVKRIAQELGISPTSVQTIYSETCMELSYMVLKTIQEVHEKL